jgi:hypothetical protein
MPTLSEIQKPNRLATKFISTVALLSLFSLTMTALAWGTAETTNYFLLLYPILLITTILIIANIRFAYFLIIAIAIAYATLLNREIGKFLVFDSHKDILYLVLALPYFAFTDISSLHNFIPDSNFKAQTDFCHASNHISIQLSNYCNCRTLQYDLFRQYFY